MKWISQQLNFRFILLVFFGALGFQRLVNDILHRIDAEMFPISKDYFGAIVFTILFCLVEYARRKKKSGENSPPMSTQVQGE